MRQRWVGVLLAPAVTVGLLAGAGWSQETSREKAGGEGWAFQERAFQEGALQRLESRVKDQLDGRDAALEQVLTSFLTLASAVRAQEESWPKFCSNYFIDPEWPSAEQLGAAGRQVIEEYTARLQEAEQSPRFQGADGADPNDWRNEAMGRAFAELLRALRLDGFDLSAPVFVGLIEEHNRGGTYYSTEPGGASLSSGEVELFWMGAESVLPGLRAEVTP